MRKRGLADDLARNYPTILMSSTGQILTKTGIPECMHLRLHERPRMCKKFQMQASKLTINNHDNTTYGCHSN